MYIVHVFIEVKPNCLKEFIEATLEIAKASIKEPGIARFDFLQDADDPTDFMLNVVYRTKDDPGRHKETAHYLRWKTVVEDLIAAPRTKKVYENIFSG